MSIECRAEKIELPFSIAFDWLLKHSLSTFYFLLSELYDDAFDLTDMLTFYQKRISEQMWNTFAAMYKSFKFSDGIDFLSEMLPTFDNVISFGTEVFKQSAEHRAMIIDIFNTALTSEQLGAGGEYKDLLSSTKDRLARHTEKVVP